MNVAADMLAHGKERTRFEKGDAIQPQGWLLGFAPDWSISHASANCGALLAGDARDLPGRSAHATLAGAALHEIRSRAQLLGGGDVVAGERLFGLDLAGKGVLVDATLRPAARGWVLACEPAAAGRRDHGGTVLRMAAALRGATTLAELCTAAARDVRALTGFDRVQVLRFTPDGGSVIVAESARTAAAGFAPLMFGARDDAALFAGRHFRLVGDRQAQGVPIHGAGGLDLAECEIAAPGDAELGGLVALGARAMISVPLVCGGEAWGAIGCCHGEPRLVPFAVRPALEMLASTLGLLVELIGARGSGHDSGAVMDDTGSAPLSGRVLVVEDNMLIAMEAEEIVGELGAAACDVTGSVATALRLIETNGYDFALLDIELGHETSAAVAQALVARGVRFAYASGYGGADLLGAGFPPAPVVTKPYGAVELAAAIGRLD